MSRTAICTIFAKNYISHARTLAESYLEQHPSSTVYGLLCDNVDGYFAPAGERFIMLGLEDLGITDLDEMIFKYDIVELSTAVKPFLLRHLFATTPVDKLCYVDPDILFLTPISDIFALLDTNNAVIVPHLLDTLKEDVIPSERHMLLTGIYNLGFIGLRRSEETDKLLRWWEGKLAKYCYADPGNGLYVDQRWIDLAPGMFAGVHIHRDPGCDIAYWNMTQRPVVRQDGQYTCLGSLVKFFHFSGYSPDDAGRISKRVPPTETRLAMASIGDCAGLFELYRELLLGHDFQTTSRWPYALGCFSNGVPVPHIARSMWKEATERGLRWDHLLDAQDPAGFYQWLLKPIDTETPLINRVARRVYDGRSDVQRAYPDLRATHRRDFVHWFTETGVNEHNIPAAFAEDMRRSLAAGATPVEQRLTAARPILTRLSETAIGRRMVQTSLAQAARRILYPPAASSHPTNGAPKAALRRPVVDGLNLIGYLSAETGVGEVPRALARALTASRYPVAITHLANPDGARRNDKSILDLPAGTPYDINLFAVNADALPTVKELLGVDLFRQKYNIGFWFWEIATFPDAWRDRFNDLQEVWVGSAFVQEAVSAVCPLPVVKMGVPIVLPTPSSLTRHDLCLPEDKFTFLYAFDMLSIPERKNPLDCIAAYRQAFAPHFNDTHLVLKVNNLHNFADWQAKLCDEVRSVQGTLIETTLDRPHLTALFQQADAYVSLHRSEGFGLTIAEAMRMGKPVIATDYSGNRDFLNQGNGFPVRYTLTELERDYGPYRAGNVWAQPDVEHAAHLMRHIRDDAHDRAARAQQAALDIEALYGPRAMAERMTHRLQHLKGC